MMFQTTDEEADFLAWATALPLGEAPLKDVFDNSYFKNHEHPELRILAYSFFIDLPLIDGLSEEGKFISDPYKLVLERFPWLEGKISWHSLAPYVFHRFAYSVRNKTFSLDYQDKIVLERARKAYEIWRRVIKKADSSKESIERIDLEYERELKRSVPSFVYVLGTYYGLKFVENPELSEYAEALVYAWSEIQRSRRPCL